MSPLKVPERKQRLQNWLVHAGCIISMGRKDRDSWAFFEVQMKEGTVLGGLVRRLGGGGDGMLSQSFVFSQLTS